MLKTLSNDSSTLCPAVPQNACSVATRGQPCCLVELLLLDSEGKAETY